MIALAIDAARPLFRVLRLTPQPRALHMRPLYLLFALVPLLATGCARGDAAPAASAPRRVTVALHEVTARPLAPRITATGTAGGKEEIELSFKVGGVIARIAVQPGAAVREGELLAELSPVEIASEVAKARQGREKAERDLARVRTLQADSVATLEQLQDATTALEVADQNVRIAEFNLRYASIRAPAPGVVLRRLAEPGQLASPGTTVLVVRSARSGVVLRAGLADRDVVRVRTGDAATVTFDALPGRRFAGRVAQVGAAASPATGTYDVEIALAGDVAALASGLVGRVEIAARSMGTYPTIPLEALLEAEGDSGTVFVVAPGADRPTRRRVVIAQLAGTDAAIASGIDAGERVIVRGAAYVDESTPLAFANAMANAVAKEGR